jgi:hypothetical protein
MQAINFDDKTARKADAGQFISQSGGYVGTILQCRMWETQNHAQMIELLFKDDDERHLWILMCLISGKGEQTFDYPRIQALMGLLGKTVLNPEPAKVRRRDGGVDDGFRCKAIEKSRIGIVVQRLNDIYEVNGEVREGHPMRLVSFFDAQTRQTYHEKADNKPAKDTDARIKNLKEFVNTKAYDDWKNGFANNGFESQARSSAEDLGEDIPF